MTSRHKRDSSFRKDSGKNSSSNTPRTPNVKCNKKVQMQDIGVISGVVSGVVLRVVFLRSTSSTQKLSYIFVLFILINRIFQQQFFPNHGCGYDPGRVPTTSSSDGSDRTDISALEADLQLATNEIKLVVQGMSHCMSKFYES